MQKMVPSVVQSFQNVLTEQSGIERFRDEKIDKLGKKLFDVITTAKTDLKW